MLGVDLKLYLLPQAGASTKIDDSFVCLRFIIRILDCIEVNSDSLSLSGLSLSVVRPPKLHRLTDDDIFGSICWATCCSEVNSFNSRQSRKVSSTLLTFSFISDYMFIEDFIYLLK